MKIQETLTCPKCKGVHFSVKREATYLYTYKLETPATENTTNNNSALPFLFDNREQINDIEYLQCDKCGEKFKYDFDKDDPKVHLTILQKAIRSDYENNPEFLG